MKTCHQESSDSVFVVFVAVGDWTYQLSAQSDVWQDSSLPAKCTENGNFN